MSLVAQGFGKGAGSGSTTIQRVVTQIEVEIENDPVAVEILVPEVEVSILTTQFILEGE